MVPTGKIFEYISNWSLQIERDCNWEDQKCSIFDDSKLFLILVLHIIMKQSNVFWTVLCV